MPSLRDAFRRRFDRLYFNRQGGLYNLDRLKYLAAGLSSADYVGLHMAQAKGFAGDLDLLDHACGLVGEGLKLEFGVFSGRTINRIASRFPDAIYGFDSFEGLPETWQPGFDEGIFKRTDRPSVAPNVKLVVGWFDQTLPPFLETHPGRAALIHVDCDLYSSTVTVLDALAGRIAPGTIIVFDEYFNYPGWQLGEHKAFAEFVGRHGVQYRYIGYVPSHQQVAVEILAIAP